MNCQPINCVHCCYPAVPLLSTHPSLFLPPLPSKPSDAAPAIISCCSCCRLLAEKCVLNPLGPRVRREEEGEKRASFLVNSNIKVYRQPPNFKPSFSKDYQQQPMLINAIPFFGKTELALHRLISYLGEFLPRVVLTFYSG